MRERFLVLDSEGMSTAPPYEVGYLVGDRSGKIYTGGAYVFPENLTKNESRSRVDACAATMYARNVEKFQKEPQKFNFCTSEEFEREFEQTLREFDICKVYAYNVKFDEGALARLLGENVVKSWQLEWRDIWSASFWSFMNCRKYVLFAESASLLTERGHIKTSAEAAAAYLRNSPSLREEHEAFSDCLLEFEILLNVFKKKKKLNFTNNGAFWKILAQYQTA